MKNMQLSKKLLLVSLITLARADAGQQTTTSTPQSYGQNLLLYSEDFSQYVWGNYYDGPTTRNANTTEVVDPLGNNHATKLAFGGFTGTRYPGVLQTGNLRISGQPYTVSIWLRGAAGGEILRIGSDDYSISSQITLTNQWQLYTFYDTSVSASQGRLFEFFTITQLATVYAYGAQLNLGSPAGYQKTGAVLVNKPTVQVVTSAGLLQIPLDSTLMLDTTSASMSMRAKMPMTDVFSPPTQLWGGLGTTPSPNFSVVMSADVALGSTVRVYVNGILMNSGGDYTISGRVITFVRAFEPGDIVQAVYTTA